MKTTLLLAACSILATGCRHTPNANTATCPAATPAACNATPAEPDAEAKTLERFFDQGIRLEAVDGIHSAAYVVFSKDSLQADVYTTHNNAVQTLERRTLPTGEPVWNIEDDDTYNLRRRNGCWTLSRRGILRYEQLSDNGGGTGPWQEKHFEGAMSAVLPHNDFRLAIRHRQHSGDGYFLLSLTPHTDRTDTTACTTTVLTGRRYTQRITVDGIDFTGWQLIPDDRDEMYNFVYDAQKDTLIYLEGDEPDDYRTIR